MAANNVATPAPAPSDSRSMSATDNTNMNAAGTTDNTAASSVTNAAMRSCSTQLGELNEKQTASLSTTDADKQFIKDVHGGNQYEVAAGQKALTKSQNDGIKMIAQHMVDDHTKADEQLTNLASRIGDHDVGGLTADQLNQLAHAGQAQRRRFRYGVSEAAEGGARADDR